MSPRHPFLVSTLAVVGPCLVAATTLQAQAPSSASSVTAVPRLVRVTGVFTPATGLPPAPVEILTLAIYAEETGGAPLWQETQYVGVGADGRYAVLLGATRPEGLPVDLFASGDARWLGRRFERPGEGEQPRVLLASVPYALKASDADTLGGRPPSAYLLAEPHTREDASATRPSVGATSAGASGGKSSTASALPLSAGTVNYLGKFVTATDLGNSAIYDAGGFVGVNTTTPFDALHVRFMNTNGAFTGYAVQNLGNTPTSYSGMLFYDQNGALGQFQGFNNSTHEYRINNIAANGSINFMLGSVSRFKVRSDGDVDLYGNIRKGNLPFLHNFGSGNTFFGLNAGNFTMSGYDNTASGDNALASNATGYENTASGRRALASNTTGFYNTASGFAALSSNTTGTANTASGDSALLRNTTGHQNTASGIGALVNNTTGSYNVAVGDEAGSQATTGSYNIYLGTFATGREGESNTIYLGVQGYQTKTVIAGIRGITTGFADAVPVVIDSAGQLGTVSSSRRFKEDIRDMGDASRTLMRLRPVTFRYQQPFADGSKPMQYGLIAEEVEDVFPDLVAHSADGQLETVKYQLLDVLLLNELQKQDQRVQEQREEIELLKARIAALEAQRQ